MGGDGGGRTIDWLVIVKRIGVLLSEVALLVRVERAAVPVRDTVFRRVSVDVEIAGCLGSFEEEVRHSFASADRLELGILDGVEKLELFGISADNPSRTARPRGEGGVALLCAGATELSVVAIEDRFMGDASTDVVDVAILTEEHVVARSRRGVLDGAVEEIDRLVALAHQHVAKLVAHGERTHGANRVGEQRLRTVEGVDVTAGDNAGGAFDGRPWFGVVGGSVTRRLHCTGDLQRHLGVIDLVLIVGHRALKHEAAEVAVGGNIIEAVIVHPDVRDVRRHVFERLLATEREELILASRVVLEKRHAELEALRPFGPAA